MRFRKGHVWRCLNDACGAQIVVSEDAALESDSNPRCCCGSMMKVRYSPPSLRSSEQRQDVRRLLQRLVQVLR
jgi:hypothetical protein